MAGGPVISVRQIGSYPQVAVSPNDLVLIQSGGLGGPYGAPTAYQLIADTLAASGPIGVNVGMPLDAAAGQLFVGSVVWPIPGGGPYYNLYNGGSPEALRYLKSGIGAADSFQENAFFWQVAPAGVAGQAVPGLVNLMSLDVAGSLSLPQGTLSVARDPAAAMEVATMQWVGNQTVASFNNRKGVVTLSAADIYGALGICPPDCIATTSSVNGAICAAINDLLRTYPAVWSWMGRVGDVFLTVADMNFATANNPPFMPPLMVPTPPAIGADPPPDPQTVVNIAWIENYLTGNPPGFATESWVENYIAQHAVTSFNGRVGLVTLTLADIQGAGGAPIASPAFSGVPSVPTAAPGSNTGQIASTAFVQAAISGATAGVASFNGRTGIVTLNSTDLTNAGGALLASPAFTGSPSAPTPAAGNSSTLLATTAFVTQAIGAAGGVSSFNTRTGAVTLVLSDVTGVGGSPINSPAFTGTPTGPTAAAGTNNTELATTAFVNAAITSIGIGVTSFEGRTGAVTLQANDISAAGGLINPNVALTGTPTAPTPTAGNSSTQIATTAFVTAAVLGGAVTTFNGRNGAVTLSGGDISGAGGALLASPTFTGTPQAPTAAPGTNTTQLATTAFVTGALATQAANSVTSFNGRQGGVTLTTADITGAGGAPIASPNFTGTPSVPTATAGTSTTQAASTAFVMNAIAASTAGVTSFNGRTGAVNLQTNDVSAVGGALLASPVFTGTPTAPTPTAGDSSTNIATTAFVSQALATAAVTSFNGRSGAVTLQLSDVTGVGGAPIASPAFTGTPTVPTAAPATNTTQAASTAFVAAAVAPFIPQNYVDNSGFTVNQRAYASGTALAAGAYGFDRWRAGGVGCTLTFTASPASTVVTITAGNLVQTVEGVNLLSATYTLSWTGSAQCQYAVGGAGLSTAFPSPIQIACSANTNLVLQFGTGTLSRVQLQLGTVATAWQPQPYALEFDRCRRFYQNWGGFSFAVTSGASGNPVYWQNVPISPPMRASPTVGLGSVAYNPNATSLVVNGTPTSLVGNLTVTAVSTNTFATAAPLTLSADL